MSGTAKSKGRVEGDKVFAQDFATQNGKLSGDGTRITWTDGVVWKNNKRKLIDPVASRDEPPKSCVGS